MNKIILYLTLLFSPTLFAQSVDNNFFYLMFNKCVYNEIDFTKSKEFKILPAPNLTIICSKNKDTDRINCKIMKTDTGAVMVEKEFEIEMNFQKVVQLKAKDHDYQKLVVHRDLKGAMYFFKEHPKIDQIRETVCSGSYNDAKDAQKLIKGAKNSNKTPIEVEDSKPKRSTPPEEITPALIGE